MCGMGLYRRRVSNGFVCGYVASGFSSGLASPSYNLRRGHSTRKGTAVRLGCEIKRRHCEQGEAKMLYLFVWLVADILRQAMYPTTAC
jgi:hypothetical protein